MVRGWEGLVGMGGEGLWGGEGRVGRGGAIGEGMG